MEKIAEAEEKKGGGGALTDPRRIAIHPTAQHTPGTQSGTRSAEYTARKLQCGTHREEHAGRNDSASTA